MKTVLWIAVFIAVYSSLKLNECEKIHTTQTPSTQERVPEDTPPGVVNGHMYLMTSIDHDVTQETRTG